MLRKKPGYSWLRRLTRLRCCAPAPPPLLSLARKWRLLERVFCSKLNKTVVMPAFKFSFVALVACHVHSFCTELKSVRNISCDFWHYNQIIMLETVNSAYFRLNFSMIPAVRNIYDNFIVIFKSSAFCIKHS